jgi:ABC-2 type transport system permease protein
VNAFAGEVLKAWKRPAVWVCGISLLAIAVTIGYAIPWLFETYPPPGSTTGLPQGTTLADLKVALYPANFVRQSVQQWSILGGVFALILGVLSQGSEYGWGTIKTLYTQRDGRLVMLFGKLGALAVVVLVLVAGLFAADAAASTAVAAIDGKSIEFPDAGEVLKGIGALYLIFGFWAIFGFALATLFRQSAMAIGLGLAYALVIEGIILGFAGQFAGWVRDLQEWFPIANTTYLARSFGSPITRGFQQAAPPVDANHAIAVLAIYVVAFALITAVVLRRRDVTN